MRGLQPGWAGRAGFAAAWHARERFPAPGLRTPREEWRLGASGLDAGCSSRLICSRVGAMLSPGPATAHRGPLQARGRRKSRPAWWEEKKKTTSGLQDSQTGVTRAGEAAAAVARTRLGCSGTVPGQGLDWQRGLPRDEFDLHGAEKCQAEPGGKEGRGETSPLRVSGDGWVLPGA